MTLRSVCLHGPESTGKSTIGPRLAGYFGTPYVAEYGRTYCEAHGTDLQMLDLVVIAEGHDRETQDALALGRYPVILDTDPLMSAVWADMLFGTRDPWFDRWDDTADLYLLFDIDLPWIADGTRLFGGVQERKRFFDLSRSELERRSLPFVTIRGEGDARFAAALQAILDHG